MKCDICTVEEATTTLHIRALSKDLPVCKECHGELTEVQDLFMYPERRKNQRG